MPFSPMERYRAYGEARARRGLLRRLRAFVPLAAGRARVEGRSLVNFSANDYLALARHPALAERAAAFAVAWGTGAGASPLVTGRFEIHAALEQKLARLKGAEAALIFNSGYQANAAVLAALLDRQVLGAEPLVFCDRLNHASTHAGCRGAGVRQIRYRHNDLDHLAELLAAAAHDPAPKFILTESVFSMDGDESDVERLLDLATRYDAVLYLDEAHATGVVGARGMGLSAGRHGERLVAMGTFSKALGCSGAYVAAPAAVCDFLVQACAGYIYSTAPSPAVVGAVDAALDLVPDMDEARTRLRHLSSRLRDGLKAAGFDTGSSTSHIVPLIVGDAEAAMALAASLEQRGFLGVAIRPPTVPPGTARIRFAVSVAHDDADIDALLQAVRELAPKEVAA